MIVPIRTLKDNYVWTIINPQQARAVIVDPGEAQPVIDYLIQHQLSLEAILLTHHHWDHTHGVAEILSQYPVSVWGSSISSIPQITHKVKEGDQISLLGNAFQVLEIPGHTKDHIAFHMQDNLFCGDTLFGGGCGRLFEGTAEEMYRSLQKIASLPDCTRIYCAHEYTQINLKFAKAVEPNNQLIDERIRRVEECYLQRKPTVPSTLAEELGTNPFLRCHLATVKNQVEQQSQHQLMDATQVFKALRQWKDIFV